MSYSETETANRSNGRLALLDFDGTISRRDTFLPFVAHLMGSSQSLRFVVELVRMICSYYLMGVAMETVKAKFLYRCLGSIQWDQLQLDATSFVLSRADKALRKEAIDCMEYFKTSGYRTIIVSANIGPLIKAFSDQLQVEYIATELHFEDGIFSGKLSTRNCKGKEKVKRIAELLDVEKFQNIVAIGNGRSDRFMLQLADRSYKSFKEYNSGVK